MLVITLSLACTNLFANADRNYIECPCNFERTEDGRLKVEMAFRSFREQDTNRVRLNTFFYLNKNDIYRYRAGTVLIGEKIPANGKAETGTYYGMFTTATDTSPTIQRSGFLRFVNYRES